MHGRCIPWPRGRVLGGTSALNAMVYIRRASGDYDLWSELGNHGWAYDDVLPFFRQSENQERGPSFYHGVGGPLNVADLRFVSPLSTAFVEGCNRIGFAGTDDFNGQSQIGAGLFQVTQKDGRRCSTAIAYLHPVRHRPNLTVEVNAQATRILFEGTTAVGIEYSTGTELRIAKASSEVILASGAIGSPHLLMLSGVGPAEHLDEFAIPCRADLPGVGRNLQDHPIAPLSYRCSEPVSLFGAATPENVELFVREGRGPLSSNVVEAGAFIKTKPELRVPNLQFHFTPIGFTVPSIGATGPLTAADFHSFAIGPTLLHPMSRGELRLKSGEPTVSPAIHTGYLSDPADMGDLARGH